ncbi:MAG: RNA 2',3'-cyclic phosphodiesterase, partial [Burkholderiales bacterium]
MTGDARIFFAAWPAPGIQRALSALAQDLKVGCGGRAPPARNIHLTLVFLGNVERDRLPHLQTLAAGITSPRFELSVDRVEYWRRNRIVWAGVTRCPEALLALVERLEQALSPAGFHFDERPYVPHITLLRDARRVPPEAAVPAVAWPVARFALVESVQRERGRVY